MHIMDKLNTGAEQIFICCGLTTVLGPGHPLFMTTLINQLPEVSGSLRPYRRMVLPVTPTLSLFRSVVSFWSIIAS